MHANYVLRLRSGFTLIELLVVVAVIAILAAIAVPNFLEAQTRAKISRFKADVRSAATAIEAYCVDSNAYPPADKHPAGAKGYTAAQLEEIPDGAAEGYMPRRLTTPISYLTSLPIDIFPSKEEGEPGHQKFHPPHYVNDQMNELWYPGDADQQFHVARTHAGLRLQSAPTLDQFDRSAVWLSHSHGVDQDHDDFESPQGFPTEYDPTNGTVSDGDILYFGPSRGFNAK